MQSCGIFQNTKKILMLCLNSKLLIVTAQCINFCRANYCTVYLQSPQVMWNRKIFSSLIMLTTLLDPLYCNNKTSTWITVWDYQWIISAMWKVHSDYSPAVMSPDWMWQNHKITQGQTSDKTCITSGGKHKLHTWGSHTVVWSLWHTFQLHWGGSNSAFWHTLIQVLWDVMPYWMIQSYTLHTFQLTHSSIPEDMNLH